MLHQLICLLLSTGYCFAHKTGRTGRYRDETSEGEVSEYEQSESLVSLTDDYSYNEGVLTSGLYQRRKTAATGRRQTVGARQTLGRQTAIGRTHALTTTKHSKRAHHNRPTRQLKPQQQPESSLPAISHHVEGDAGFLKRLALFRENLFYEGERMEKILDTVLVQPGETHLTKQPVAKWLPIECKVMPLQLKKEKVIHSGRRNTVYEMVDPTTGRRYAYKTFQKPDEYTAEINFNMFSRHPFIAKAVCIQPLDDQAGIVFELVDGMSSMAYARRPETSAADLVRISAQLLLAMEYVHWLGFVHADLKPENVMIDKQGNIKVIDFGFAIPLPFYKTNRGTPTTIAPELVQAVNGPVHEGIDWWAYASTLGIWHGLQVSRSKSRKFVPVRVDRSEGITFGKIPSEFPDDLRQLMYVGLTPNPDRRKFNTRKLLEFLKKMPYFRKFVWPEVDMY